MHKFKVGQKVVRIVEWWCHDRWEGRQIHKDEIVTVREVYTSMCGLPSLRFEGIHNPPHSSGREYGYAAEEFAPLIEPATGFVEVTFSKVVETEPKICAS